MKIDKIGHIKNIPDKQKLESKTRKQEKIIASRVHEYSKVEDKGHIYDKATIDDLKKISDRSHSYLKQLIEDLISRQGKTVSLLSNKSPVTIDETTRKEANKLIDKDGPLGIKAVSDSIVDFAKALSGGDKSKLDTLKKAIDKGFKAAEQVLGKLPTISRETYDQIMEKLDNWENE